MQRSSAHIWIGRHCRSGGRGGALLVGVVMGWLSSRLLEKFFFGHSRACVCNFQGKTYQRPRCYLS